MGSIKGIPQILSGNSPFGSSSVHLVFKVFRTLDFIY